MTALIAIYLGIIGLMTGSFALALADRLHAKKDWVRDRSRCDACKRVLSPIDLVPVLSWLAFKGRCRTCKVRLSPAYPLVELLVGVMYAVSFVFWPIELSSVASISQFIVWLIALVIMATLLVYDLRWYLLPFKLVNPLIALSAVFWLLALPTRDGAVWPQLVELLAAMTVTYGLFWFMHTYSKGKWLGGGDVRLAIAIGFFTGSIVSAWLAVFAASVVGLLSGVPVLLRTKKGKRSKLKIPFGPSLLAGVYIAVVFGERLVQWYERFLVP